MISFWEIVLGFFITTGHHVTRQSNLPINYWLLSHPPAIKRAWTALKAQVSNIQRCFKCPQLPQHCFSLSVSAFMVSWDIHANHFTGKGTADVRVTLDSAFPTILKKLYGYNQWWNLDTPAGLGKHFPEGCIWSESVSLTWLCQLYSLQHWT